MNFRRRKTGRIGELRRRVDHLRYYWRHFMLWHDFRIGRPAHESLHAIINNEDHRFYFSKRRKIRAVLYGRIYKE